MNNEIDLKKIQQDYKKAKQNSYLTYSGLPIDSLTTEQLKALLWYSNQKN